MVFDTLSFELVNRVGILTINKPESLNALNSKVLTELSIAVDQLKDRDDVDVII
ncbi:hypothetical protein JCM19376_13320 [Fusibacter bizertensis]